MVKVVIKSLFLVIAFFQISHGYTQPLVSIITSVYKGDLYIEHFLSEITKQTIYSKCEHIIINANSPHHEESVILKYVDRYPNIKYLRLDFDPGLYGVWNIALLMSSAEYIITANIDDQMSYSAIEELLEYIELCPEVDLVYGDLYMTHTPNQKFSEAKDKYIRIQPEFSLNNLIVHCVPGNHPLWRKSMHFKYGLFDPSFKICGDYEMWVRAASMGALFQRYPHATGLFYIGENTLSEGLSTTLLRKKEAKLIQRKYASIWP